MCFKGMTTELFPIFFGRVCQGPKKAGTALAPQVYPAIFSVYMRRGQSPFFAYRSRLFLIVEALWVTATSALDFAEEVG